MKGLSIGEGELLFHDPARGRWKFFGAPVGRLVARSTQEVWRVLEEARRLVLEEGMFVGGFLSYESAPAFEPAFVVRGGERLLPLVWLGVYEGFDWVESLSVFESDVQRDGVGGVEEVRWEPSLTDEAYKAALGEVKEHIHRGDTYQANYSFRLRASLEEGAFEFFQRMIRARGRRHYGAFVQDAGWAVCSASPELFFRLSGEELSCRPMKGTIGRGRWTEEDLEFASWLVHSEKNRAENAMIVDMVRNDMSRVAKRGSVEVRELFEIEKYPTLWQMTSTVGCQTEADVPEIFEALFPAASITGAPKIRTMELIAGLEDTPRQIYTGAIGFWGPQREALFNISIRTAFVDRGSRRAEYGVGGGIVWDSSDAAELEECQTKARLLTHTRPSFCLLETCLWEPEGGIVLLDEHLGRLAKTAEYFDWGLEFGELLARFEEVTSSLPLQAHRLRLTVSKEGEVGLEATPLTPLPSPYQVRLAVSPVDSGEVLLFHKTTHRACYEQAMVGQDDVEDVLLWNERGELTESCIANLAIEREGVWRTPPLGCGVLPGTMRAKLLGEGRLVEEVLPVGLLEEVSEVILMNSVRGVWRASLKRSGEG